MPEASRKLGIALFAFVGATLLLGPIAYATYVNHQRNYWDERVIEFCKRDAGVIVYEVVPIGQTSTERNEFWLTKISAHDNKPYKVIERKTVIRSADPKVIRIQWDYLRTSSNKLLGTMINYYRYGGDFPILFAESSRFSCNVMSDFRDLSDNLIFVAGPYREVEVQ